MYSYLARSGLLTLLVAVLVAASARQASAQNVQPRPDFPIPGLLVENAPVRDGPFPGRNPYAELPKGTRVVLVDCIRVRGYNPPPCGPWYQLEDGGWIEKWRVETGPQAADPAAGSPAPQRTRPSATGPICNSSANLRQGPGTSYSRIGGCSPGQSLTVTGRNAAGDWLQLRSGAWIAAFLVDNAPRNLPVVQATRTPVQPPAPTTGPQCDSAYPTVCIPSPPPDVDCRDVQYRSFRVLAPDPHNFDLDFDGTGCEPYN